MNRNPRHFLFLSMLILLFVVACKKTYQYPSDPLSVYVPQQVGKYITYRMDSLVFFNFGTQDTIIKYLAKDVIDDSITDNLGRPSWRVVRYISDTTGTAPWTPIETYMITATNQTVEVVENNMRFIKLVSPVVNGYIWSGNSYIDTKSSLSTVVYLDGWNYVYDSVGMPFTTNSEIVPSSVTIHQADDSSGSLIDTVFSTRNFSEEVYGKGIGLIYKNFIHWEYQPPNVNVPVGSFSGYGIKLMMVDHN